MIQDPAPLKKHRAGIKLFFLMKYDVLATVLGNLHWLFLSKRLPTEGRLY